QLRFDVDQPRDAVNHARGFVDQPKDKLDQSAFILYPRKRIFDQPVFPITQTADRFKLSAKSWRNRRNNHTGMNGWRRDLSNSRAQSNSFWISPTVVTCTRFCASGCSNWGGAGNVDRGGGHEKCAGLG